MNSNIKIDSYLSNCNSECRKEKKLDYLYFKYLKYYQKYANSYYEYLVYKDGNNSENNSSKYRQYLNEMTNIEKMMRMGISTLNTHIEGNKKILNTNNNTINKLLVNNEFLNNQYNIYLKNNQTSTIQYQNKKNTSGNVLIHYYGYYIFLILEIILLIILLIIFLRL